MQSETDQRLAGAAQQEKRQIMRPMREAGQGLMRRKHYLEGRTCAAVGVRYAKAIFPLLGLAVKQGGAYINFQTGDPTSDDQILPLPGRNEIVRLDYAGGLGHHEKQQGKNPTLTTMSFSSNDKRENARVKL